jgi:FkbM family methyltransferase
MRNEIRQAAGTLIKRVCGLRTIHGHTFVPGLLSTDSVVVDFGCNCGEFAFEFRQSYRCEYRAADANPAMVEAAEKRLGIKVEHVAVGDNDGEVEFLLSSNPEASSIFPAIAGTDVQGQIRVPMLSYTSWALKHGIDRVALLKLDVEGAELGLIETWGGSVARPGQLTIEFHDFLHPAHRSRVRSCIKRLRSLGYEYINGTRPNHIDCLFVDQTELRGVNGLMLKLRWRLLSLVHNVRGWLRERDRRAK